MPTEEMYIEMNAMADAASLPSGWDIDITAVENGFDFKLIHSGCEVEFPRFPRWQDDFRSAVAQIAAN